jgi:hypothetical protein
MSVSVFVNVNECVNVRVGVNEYECVCVYVLLEWSRPASLPVDNHKYVLLFHLQHMEV